MPQSCPTQRVRKLRYLSFMSFTSIGWNLFPSLFPRGNHTPAVRQKAQAISEVPRAVTAHARAWIYLFIYSFIHSFICRDRPSLFSLDFDSNSGWTRWWQPQKAKVWVCVLKMIKLLPSLWVCLEQLDGLWWALLPVRPLRQWFQCGRDTGQGLQLHIIRPCPSMYSLSHFTTIVFCSWKGL